MMTLTDEVIKRIIEKLLTGQDYRIEVVSIINARFLEYVIGFFERIVKAKLNQQAITPDWYKAELLDPRLSSDELIIHSGLNRKTVSNMYGSARREIVLQVTAEHYQELYELINSLVEQNSDIDVTLTLKFHDVSVNLTISESLVVINTLAVKRAELRGGAWSTTGKRVEKMLVLTLCQLYKVPEQNYELAGLTGARREADFHLIGRGGKRYNGEVKLMGQGNPESADAVYARDTDIFIADTLSDLNRQQLAATGVHWIELHQPRGYRKFGKVLRTLNIPHTNFTGDLQPRLQEIFCEIF